jgi:uncharacterized protein YjbJ (UPF0337 family)
MRPGGAALSSTITTEERTMGNWDEAKGTTKERLGEATDDAELKREGQADKAAGKAKQAADDAADKAADGVDKLRDKIT